jgi:hypothetical protein
MRFAASTKAVEESEALQGNCCGNGCRDCVLLDGIDSASQDYFAKIEATISTPAPSEHASN